jgi:hypothetical protein
MLTEKITRQHVYVKQIWENRIFFLCVKFPIITYERGRENNKGIFIMQQLTKTTWISLFQKIFFYCGLNTPGFELPN